MTAGGSIMTLTYLGSTRVVTNYNMMGVAKAALEAEVKYLASELGKSKIRVNAISAGPIKTISARGIKDFSKVLDFVAQHAPLRRNTDIAEVADTAVFLASDLGRGVTGNIDLRGRRLPDHGSRSAFIDGLQPERIPASSRILILRVSSATCSRLNPYHRPIRAQ